MSKKIFLIIFLFLFLTPSFVLGKEAGESAKITYKTILQEVPTLFYKKTAIRNILKKYQSPLAEFTDSFIQVCLNYQINCYLLPAIAGVESTFGRYILPYSFNPFGWGGGQIVFKNWEEAIEKVGFGIKKNYIDYGLTSIEAIANLYSQNPNWSKNVWFFINQFEKEEENLRLYFEKNKVKL